ncbi:MAG: hypothetical protein ABI835_02880 [Chloroflexota bacterium]
MSPVIRRHRLPTRYRVGLTVLWMVPLGLFVAAIVSQRGLDPALYFWREGIDVLPDGIYRRMHVPQYYAFSEMTRWHYDARKERHVLTIWDETERKIVECRAGHLTDFPALLEVLEERVRE